MHRQPLIELLREYHRAHPEEDVTTRRFLDFVARNERCFQRDLWEGHITGSAWLVSRDEERVLLTHHRKLGRWLQLGGHSDGDPDPLRVAMTEAREESGLAVEALSAKIFDLDVHEIPARRDDPAHLHYDVRFALKAAEREDFVVSEESFALAWVPIHRLREYSNEPSMLRMARKWLSRG